MSDMVFRRRQQMQPNVGRDGALLQSTRVTFVENTFASSPWKERTGGSHFPPWRWPSSGAPQGHGWAACSAVLAVYTGGRVVSGWIARKVGTEHLKVSGALCFQPKDRRCTSPCYIMVYEHFLHWMWTGKRPQSLISTGSHGSQS
jgi:hypothetical protein